MDENHPFNRFRDLQQCIPDGRLEVKLGVHLNAINLIDLVDELMKHMEVLQRTDLVNPVDKTVHSLGVYLEFLAIECGIKL